MANTSSAKKAARKAVKRRTINTARKERFRTAIKKVEAAIKSGNGKTATDALKKAKPEIHRAVTKGILHKNTAARKLSRLNAAIKKLSAK